METPKSLGSVRLKSQEQKTKEWFESLHSPLRRTVFSLIDQYGRRTDIKQKIAIDHALGTVRFLDHATTAEEQEEQATNVLCRPAVALDRLQRFEKSVTDPNDVVIVKDRLEDLNSPSSLRHSTQLEFSTYSEDRRSSLAHFDDGSSVPMFPVLEGFYTVEEVRRYAAKSWQTPRFIIGKEVVEAQLEEWSLEQVRDGSKKALHVFNTCIDIEETTGIDFIDTNDAIKALVDSHKEELEDVIIEQLHRHIYKYIAIEEGETKKWRKKEEKREMPHLDKYFLALEKLGVEKEELAEGVLTFISGYQEWSKRRGVTNNGLAFSRAERVKHFCKNQQDSTKSEVSTLPLCEAA